MLAALAAGLAGCAADGGGAAPGIDGDGPPALAATATTGVIRGVVVDDAIRPIANATVQARGGPGADGAGGFTAITGADGFFGFTGLAPGTWFVTAAKLGHAEAQQSVEVAAGVGDPSPVRLLLTPIPGQMPFLVEAKAEAFVQCIVPGANVCAIANLYPCAVAGHCQPVVDDTSYVLYYDPLVELQRPPDWFQTELVWDSTQSVSPKLALLASAHSPDDGAGRDVRQAVARGASPLVLEWGREDAEEWDMGTDEGVSYEIFGHMDETSAGGSFGFVLNQRVTYFFHGFYGYLPPEGWRFTDAPAPAPPR